MQSKKKNVDLAAKKVQNLARERRPGFKWTRENQEADGSMGWRCPHGCWVVEMYRPWFGHVWTAFHPFVHVYICVFVLFLFSTLNFKDWIHGDDVDLGTVAIGFEWFWFHVGEAFAVRGGWVVRWLLLPKRCSAGRVFGWESWLRFSGSPDTFYMNPDSLISSSKFFLSSPNFQHELFGMILDDELGLSPIQFIKMSGFVRWNFCRRKWWDMPCGPLPRGTWPRLTGICWERSSVRIRAVADRCTISSSLPWKHKIKMISRPPNV